MKLSDVVIVGNFSDDPFAIDVAYAVGQSVDVSDLISLKTFANGEFCPRFISDELDLTNIGQHLSGKTVVIVSTSNRLVSRQNLAMRTFLIARAAKENGAEKVMLVEPDLYYSAQDRGPSPALGATVHQRDSADLKKFDGQPFTAKLYAEMLRLSGVDAVMTVHNHSFGVQTMFSEVFKDEFYNLIPYDIYLHYLKSSDIVGFGERGERLALCAPDEGARDFVEAMFSQLDLPDARFVLLDKERTGEREVEISLHRDSPCDLSDLNDRDLVLFDDMVRTGSTVVKSCEFLLSGHPRRVIFGVSHFYASDEGREKMASGAISEILTLNTMPTVLNRDEQGRLRRKMVVLKIEQWLGHNLGRILGLGSCSDGSAYKIDMSSKNPRFRRKIWTSDELKTL